MDELPEPSMHKPSIVTSNMSSNGSHPNYTNHPSMPESRATSSPPIFQPMVARTPSSDRFISTASVIMLVVFFLLLRSSAGPFLNPQGEAKKIRTSFFFNATCFLYIWIISVTVVTLIPAFSIHYNGVIAASLFFPMTFVSIAALLIGRFMIRLIFYLLIRCGIIGHQKNGKNQNTKINKNKIVINKNRTFKASSYPIMVAFHRPFRKLSKNAALLSGILCLLYAHCWSRTLSVFKVSANDGAGAICRATFTPFVRGDNDVGAKEGCIWYFWAVVIFIMTISFAQDEWNGLHVRSDSKSSDKVKIWRGKTNDGEAEGEYEEYDSTDDDSIDDSSHHDVDRKGIPSFSSFLPKTSITDGPKDTQEMVPWLSLFAASSVIDIFLQLKVFGGRVDARAMQSALQRTSINERSASEIDSVMKKDAKDDIDEETKFRFLQEKYRGCIFDYSSKLKKDSDGGFWFDFMADCGDGFNSSYQVARMLAQPKLLAVAQNNENIELPRGQFLVNGGDLAYPDPSVSSYEKRFFRTFEDAMPPPPSFRRSKIATKKPDLPTKGWKHCFHEGVDSDDTKDIHELYKGPSTFIIPGNHDWYDGLATYLRLILCRDWLGGWLMPQQRSYFALKLHQGWWILGMDCALSGDIDVEQYKFFADIATDSIGDEDAVIVVNHEPHWVTDFDVDRQNDEMSEQNMRELMKRHLQGKVRLRLAGDLHHYTRHVPASKSSYRRKRRVSRSRSLSFDASLKSKDKKIGKKDYVEPFVEENRPELIVSGGGGAFMHGTHLYCKNIKVGEERLNYKRVCAYPTENISYLIGSMNLWHFRRRNYRTDWLMALVYFGIVSSLFPLCGIYADYEAFNPDHELGLFVVWSLRKVGSLMWRIITEENASLFWTFVLVLGCIAIQASDNKMNPKLRLMVSCLHGLAHIAAALSCLLFVQSVTEWIVQDDIVNISVVNQHFNGTNLASSLYDEYKQHFSPVLQNFTHPDSSKLAQYYVKQEIMKQENYFMFRRALEFILDSWKWLTTIPLLKTSLSIFDLPGLVAHHHHDICGTLCDNGMECLVTHDKYRFLIIERVAYLKYIVAISLYFVCVAIPFAGGIFGGWLTITSNVFKSQSDLAFSALMVEHWKNFLKLHIKDNGDLEVFAIGLQKVPTNWTKDSKWDGRRTKRQKNNDSPTWSWNRPSKWVPVKNSKSCNPRIVDYTCIRKRRINTSST
mmetsp:Transcript_9815/g.10864  ORF Transcript_9815/g.10864 Transcript_9815/m.10864 type:complete len:1205 (-) Transcript_9815:65-3679(-)